MKNNLMGVISGVVLTLAVTACGKEPEVQELILGPVPDQQEVSIRLSAPAGFYDEPFSLTMEAGEHIIYYTLDGSMPTMESPVYEEADRGCIGKRECLLGKR